MDNLLISHSIINIKNMTKKNVQKVQFEPVRVTAAAT